MKKVIKTNMHVYTITENGGKVSMVSDNPNENFNFEGVETSIDSVMQRFEVAMKLRGEVICESITDGWVDGEWAWEDDGTKPKAPADPEMKAWLESLGCKFDEDDAPMLETEDPLTYENVKLFAEQYDIHMGCDGKYVLPRGIAQDNWDEYLTFVENIDLEYTKEYWDKFWKIYCNVMRDLWKEEYEVVVDNCHDRLIFTPMIDENDAPCLDDAENVRDYLNNDERAFFVLPDYDYVCGLFVEYNEDDDVYVAMGNESWNATEYDGDTDMSVVIADFSNAWAKEIDEYCDFYKGLDYDRRIYRNDDYDAYMILLNSGVSHGLNVEEGYDPYKGDYVEVIA